MILKSVLFLLAISGIAVAHEGPPQRKAAEVGVLDAINEKYVEKIKPIFQRSCFDCHSSQTRYPWYYRFPGTKELIDADIAEAKKHIDMDRDFPFEGHGTPSEDLEAIQATVRENTMPPWRYKILHWGSGLTEEEKQVILQWIEESRDKLFWEKNKQ